MVEVYKQGGLIEACMKIIEPLPVYIETVTGYRGKIIEPLPVPYSTIRWVWNRRDFEKNVFRIRIIDKHGTHKFRRR